MFWPQKKEAEMFKSSTLRQRELWKRNQEVMGHLHTSSPSALTCFYSVFPSCNQTPVHSAECQQFVLFPVDYHCPPSLPLCSTGHSFRIYTCHFSFVVNIYGLHYYIIECVAAGQLIQGAIDPPIWSAELLILGDRCRALFQILYRALKWAQGALLSALLWSHRAAVCWQIKVRAAARQWSKEELQSSVCTTLPIQPIIMK